MNNLKLYIARDEGKWDEDVQKAGELNLFYNTCAFSGGRIVEHKNFV